MQNLRIQVPTCNHGMTLIPVKRSYFSEFFFVMGLGPKATYNTFWSTHPFFRNSFFSKTTKRDRFRYLLSYLHTVDNSHQATSNDKLFKIRPFIETISANFKSLFYPGKQLSLDEGSCPFKSRWDGVTYNPNKPHKWGIKVYKLCDSVTGYCCKFRIAAEQSVATWSSST